MRAKERGGALTLPEALTLSSQCPLQKAGVLSLESNKRMNTRREIFVNKVSITDYLPS